MSKIFFHVGITLDGYLAGPNGGPKNPIGDNGTKIHTWMYRQKGFLERFGAPGGETGKDNDLVEYTFNRTGAYVMGKRMFDEGETNWPENAPFQAPVFVVTHQPREPWVRKGGTTFYFVNDGIYSALEKAKQAAGNKDVRINGGANLIQQYLNAGLIDEFDIQIAPMFMTEGVKLFEDIEKQKFSIELTETFGSKDVTHMRYKVINK
jgi:dihydrofolate reductase